MSFLCGVRFLHRFDGAIISGLHLELLGTFPQILVKFKNVLPEGKTFLQQKFAIDKF